MRVHQLTLLQYFTDFQGDEKAPQCSIDWINYPEPGPSTPVLLANVDGWISTPHPGNYSPAELGKFIDDTKLSAMNARTIEAIARKRDAGL